MPAVKLGTIFIDVTILERSIEFYTNYLGLTSRGIEDWGNGKRGATLFFGNRPTPMVTLVEVDKVRKIDKPLFNFICINIEEMYSVFRDNGLQVTELEQWESEWNSHLLFDVADPDGNVINLIEMHSIEAVYI